MIATLTLSHNFTRMAATMFQNDATKEMGGIHPTDPIITPNNLPTIAPNNPPTITLNHSTTLCQSKQNIKPVNQLIKVMQNKIIKWDGVGELFGYTATCPAENTQNVYNDLITMKTKAHPDILYLHKA